MTKQLAVAARDHGPGITDQRLHGVAGGRCLPFIAVECADTKNDLRDRLARGPGAMAVEGLQHPAQTRPLLAGQARIGWDLAAMQGGEKTLDCFEPIQPIQAERDDRRGWCDAIVDELDVVPIAEIEKNIGAAVHTQRDGGVYFRQRIDWWHHRRRGPEHDDAGVMLR